jgi:N-acetylglucosamine-6-phosphate deacetylase
MIIVMKVIDVHTHGIGGYDTRTNVLDHILKIADIHGSHGVSEIVLSIYPAKLELMRENMEVVNKAIDKQNNTKSKLKVQSSSRKTQHSKRKTLNSKLKTQNLKLSSIIGVHLEGPFLNTENGGALDKETFIEPTEYHFEKLVEGFEGIVKIITIAPEMKGAPRLIKKMADRGIIVSMGHSNATFAEAEEGYHAGARGITHIFNAMRGFHHREPGLAGFGLLHSDVYIEVIADPYHLDEKTLELIFRIKNPERILIVSDTVRKSKTTENQAITDVHKKLSGGCLTITESSARLIEMGFDEHIVEHCITKNPERYLSKK